MNIQLSTLDGTNGFRIDGVDLGDNSGFSVSGAGDVNGDGIDDVIIGARLGDAGATNSGESYVVFGSDQGFASSLDLSELDGSNGFRHRRDRCRATKAAFPSPAPATSMVTASTM